VSTCFGSKCPFGVNLVVHGSNPSDGDLLPGGVNRAHAEVVIGHD
jgi:hypothetical protein